MVSFVCVKIVTLMSSLLIVQGRKYFENKINSFFYYSFLFSTLYSPLFPILLFYFIRFRYLSLPSRESRFRRFRKYLLLYKLVSTLIHTLIRYVWTRPSPKVRLLCLHVSRTPSIHESHTFLLRRSSDLPDFVSVSPPSPWTTRSRPQDPSVLFLKPTIRLPLPTL